MMEILSSKGINCNIIAIFAFNNTKSTLDALTIKGFTSGEKYYRICILIAGAVNDWLVQSVTVDPSPS